MTIPTVPGGDARGGREIAFVVGVLAPVSGDAPDQKPLGERRFIEIENVKHLDTIMESLQTTFTLDLPYVPGSEEGRTLTIRLRSLADLGPDRLLQLLTEADPYLSAVYRLRELLGEVRNKVKTDKALRDEWAAAADDPAKIEVLLSRLLKERS